MERDDATTTARALALGHWQEFCAKLLFGAVRRICAWKALPPALLRDVVDDVTQELAADACAESAAIAAMSPAARTARWLRIAERTIYREILAARRRRTVDAGACMAAGLQPEWARIDGAPAVVAALANGRCNLTATAAQAGLPRASMRRRLDETARRCGADEEARLFWRRRVAEALTGLACDLLRTADRVHLLPRTRPAPDVRARLRRLRRLSPRLPLQPATRREREIVRRWLRCRRFGPGAPLELLAAATALAPDLGAAWAWRFEACAAAGDAAGAAAALRRARSLAGLTPAAAALARARLRELRGDRRGALAVLRRSLQRRPRDRTLAAVAATAGVDGQRIVPRGLA